MGKAGGKEEDEEDEEGEEEAQSSGQGPSGSGPTPYQQALAQCNDLACLTAAAAAERVPGQYRFPHFYIVGWQARPEAVACWTACGSGCCWGLGVTTINKCHGGSMPRANKSVAHSRSKIPCPRPAVPQKCATTSLYHHLKDHPTVLASKDKVRG